VSLIGVIDYGAGNLRSLVNAIRSLNREIRVMERAETKGISVLILPGVGAFGSAMEKLRNYGWIEEIYKWLEAEKPLIGICLGMQLLFEYSEEEGVFEGLGVFKGWVRKLPKGNLPIPHMGWNEVILKRSSSLLEGFPFPKYFYFAHSYCPFPEDEGVVIGETLYGISFPSIIGRGKNIIGFQFHPEKSGEWGLRLLEFVLERVEGRC